MAFNLTTLSEYAKVQGGFAYKSKDFIEYSDNKVLKIKNVRFGTVNYEDSAFISNEIAQSTKLWETQEGDILISMTGSGPNAPQSLVGRVARVWANEPKAYINQRVGRIKLKEEGKVHSDFLFYLLSLPQSQDFLVSNSSGSANQANISGKIIEMLPCPEVTFEESESIANIARSLDEKIILNRQTNQTLEQMAQALFKSWFVDFDPVFDNALARGLSVNDFPEALQKKALFRQQQRQQEPSADKKAEAKPLPEDIRQLFPSEFEQTDEPSIGINGWIPKGWSLDSFAMVATLKNKSIHPKKEPEKLWAQFSLPAFDNGKMPTLDLGIEIKSAKYKLSENTVLVSKLNPHTPRIWMPKVSDTDVSVCSTEFMPFQPVNNEHRVFVYSLMNSESVKSKIASRVTGTTGSHQRVSPKEVAVMPVLLPSLECITSFSNLIKSSFDKVELNLEQNIELTKLRDTLLPKLISGELQLQE